MSICVVSLGVTHVGPPISYSGNPNSSRGITINPDTCLMTVSSYGAHLLPFHNCIPVLLDMHRPPYHMNELVGETGISDHWTCTIGLHGKSTTCRGRPTNTRHIKQRHKQTVIPDIIVDLRRLLYNLCRQNRRP